MSESSEALVTIMEMVEIKEESFEQGAIEGESLEVIVDSKKWQAETTILKSLAQEPQESHEETQTTVKKPLQVFTFTEESPDGKNESVREAKQESMSRHQSHATFGTESRFKLRELDADGFNSMKSDFSFKEGKDSQEQFMSFNEK